MSDTPQDPETGVEEGGYGYPTLEQEVTPEVLHAGAGSDDDSDGGDGPEPGDADPSPVEPTD